MITPEERKRLRDLEAKATSGPWKVLGYGVQDEIIRDMPAITGFDRILRITSGKWNEDGALIVAVRNALSALLDALDEQDVEIERWKKKELSSWMSGDASLDAYAMARAVMDIKEQQATIDEQDKEIARLKATNEQLDDERRTMTDQVAEWGPQIVHLKAENERLKKTLKDYPWQEK